MMKDPELIKRLWQLWKKFAEGDDPAPSSEVHEILRELYDCDQEHNETPRT